jgi:hypothetical protein
MVPNAVKPAIGVPPVGGGSQIFREVERSVTTICHMVVKAACDLAAILRGFHQQPRATLCFGRNLEIAIAGFLECGILSMHGNGLSEFPWILRLAKSS